MLEIEELHVPVPLWWEYVWCVSTLATFVGLWATKRNRIRAMQQYMAGIVVFGFVPLIYCIVYYFNDVLGYMSYDSKEVDIKDSDIMLWRVSGGRWRQAREQEFLLIAEWPAGRY